jgi:plastocyanin
MMGRRHTSAAAGLALLAAGAGYGVAGAASGISGGPSSATVIVKAVYVPLAVHVVTGGKVIWSFEDGKTSHTVTADDNSFGSPPNGQSGGTFEHVFAEPGTVRYHCDFHPEMFGIINVS